MMRPHLLPAFVTLMVIATTGRPDEPKTEPGKPIARRVHYSGRVQGVGFRDTTAEIARGYAVTGWVKNLSDGRVELLVEGREDAVLKFLAAVRARWKRNIDREQIDERKPTGDYKSFTVKR